MGNKCFKCLGVLEEDEQRRRHHHHHYHQEEQQNRRRQQQHPHQQQQQQQQFTPSSQVISNVVEEAQIQAQLYGQKRSECIEQSQLAWNAGDKRRARELSDEGKVWGHKMEHARKNIAHLIITQQDANRTGEIDLHGLFVKEALEETEKFLNHWCKAAAFTGRTTIVIITGAGHHSIMRDQPVIRPKVQQMLRSRQLSYESIHNDGAFLVHLRQPQ